MATSATNEILARAESLQKRFNELLQKLKVEQKDLTRFQVKKPDKYVSCRLDPKNHRMPPSALENHELRCALKKKRIDPDKLDLGPSLRFAYDGCPGVVSFCEEGEELHNAIEELREQEEEEDKRASIVPLSSFLSLPQPLSQIADLIVEDGPAPVSSEPKHVPLVAASSSSDVERLPKTKAALKNFIRNWNTTIPVEFARVDADSIDEGALRLWVVQNVHEFAAEHLFRSRDDIDFLVQTALSAGDPESIFEQLHPIMGKNTRAFVFDLWKQIALLSTDAQFAARPEDAREYEETVSAASAPGPSSFSERKERESEAVSRVQAIARQNRQRVLAAAAANLERASKQAQEDEAPVHTSSFNPKTARYDSIVSEAQSKRSARHWKPAVPNAKALEELLLLPADARTIVTKEEHEKTTLELLKEQRDYKRRRKSYRAKHTHITKRTPVQISRDVLAGRMKYAFPEEWARLVAQQEEHRKKLLREAAEREAVHLAEQHRPPVDKKEKKHEEELSSSKDHHRDRDRERNDKGKRESERDRSDRRHEHNGRKDEKHRPRDPSSRSSSHHRSHHDRSKEKRRDESPSPSEHSSKKSKS